MPGGKLFGRKVLEVHAGSRGEASRRHQSESPCIKLIQGGAYAGRNQEIPEAPHQAWPLLCSPNEKENESRIFKEKTVSEKKKPAVEAPVVDGAVVSQAIPSMADSVPAIVPPQEASLIVLSQVWPTAPAAVKPAAQQAGTAVPAPAGKRK